MNTYHVVITYPTERTFEVVNIGADTAKNAGRLAAQLARNCGWRELPKKITAKQIEEKAA